MPDAATLDAPADPKSAEHPMTRLKREHGELTAKVAELEAALAEARKPRAQTAPPAPQDGLPFTPAQVIPGIVAALLAGGRQSSEVRTLATTAWHDSIAVVRDLDNPTTQPARVASTKAAREALQARWEEKDKQAQGEFFEVKKKTDAMNRSSSLMEKENLAGEIKGHLQRGHALIAECNAIEAEKKALTA